VTDQWEGHNRREREGSFHQGRESKAEEASPRDNGELPSVHNGISLTLISNVYAT
jgi:hypothetical protein